MATKKPAKTSSKKSSTKPKAPAAKTTKPAATKEKTVGTTTITTTTKQKVFAGFFDKKYAEDESILTIFKCPKIYGALMGELVGTMLLSVLLLTLGIQPLYVVFGALAITVGVFGLSGANLNPLITAGMMATRRMSAIRGVLYILAQIVGAWLGLLLVNAFRLGSGTAAELPTMTELTGDSFWAVALVELVGAIFIAFFFARALQYKKSPLTFGLIVTSGVTFAIIFGIVVSQSYFEMQNTFIFEPAVALMYQILPTAADGFGELMGGVGMALLAYWVFPIVGGIAGFMVSDVASKLVGEKVKE